MPSLKSLSLRLRSVTSTAKITKAMKMVAASKLRGAETKMKAARPFASSINELFATYLEPKEDDAPETKALLAVSSDKGLCGGINSRVVKEIKRIYDEEPAVEPKVRTTHTFTREGPPPRLCLLLTHASLPLCSSAADARRLEGPRRPAAHARQEDRHLD